MRHAPLILVVMLVAACDAPQVMAVDSNVRNPGEPSTSARQLSPDEQREVVKAIAGQRAGGSGSQALGAGGRERALA